jgi:hypothetical protein
MPDAKPTPSPTEEFNCDDGVVLVLLTTGDQRPGRRRRLSANTATASKRSML